MADATPSPAQIDADRLARLLNGIQTSVSWRDRATIAETLAGCTNNILPRLRTEMRPDLHGRAGNLQRDGLAYLGSLLSPAQVGDIHAYLKNKACYTGHVPTYGDG